MDMLMRLNSININYDVRLEVRKELKDKRPRKAYRIREQSNETFVQIEVR
jgi:hypothetical protein